MAEDDIQKIRQTARRADMEIGELQFKREARIQKELEKLNDKK